MIDKYTLVAYRSAISNAKKRAKNQAGFLKKIGMTEEQAIKPIVIDYFTGIRCKFNHEAFDQAMKDIKEAQQ